MKLDHNQLEGNLKPLSKITEMRELNLKGNSLTGSLDHLSGLTYLTALYVLGNSVDKHAHHLHFIPKKSSDIDDIQDGRSDWGGVMLIMGGIIFLLILVYYHLQNKFFDGGDSTGFQLLSDGKRQESDALL